MQKAIISYGKFQDKIVPDVGYLGKDFTLFDIVKRVEEVDNDSLYLESLLRLDQLYIEKSRKDLEAARKKSNGK